MDSTTFNIIAWNIRGGVGARGRRRMNDLLQSYHPSLVTVCETHCKFERVASIWRQQGYELIREVEARGHSGGIWILAPLSRAFDVVFMEECDQAISVNVNINGKRWMLSALYASPNPIKRLELWYYLSGLRGRCTLPWLALGDLNEVCSPSEVIGGDFSTSRATNMLNMMEECNFIDLGFTGPKFTWERRVNGRRIVAKRLDRALGDVAWRMMYSEAYVEHLARVYSDHSPLIQQTVPERLRKVQEAASDFNRTVFGNIHKRKRRVERRLLGIQREMDWRGSEALVRLERNLQKEYGDILYQEEMLWYQKSRENWVRRNHIMENQTPTISLAARDLLNAPVSLEEVRSAIMSMHSFKAPGVDGFQAFFYKKYWHILGEDIHYMVASAFQNGGADPELLETLLVLIPKVDNPVRLKEMRPISLCNVSYKIITKVLVNRIRPLLHDLVHPLQGSFIPGRGTRDNIILAQEVMHTIHTQKKGRGLVAIKIDLEKAYDRVSWDFLRATLYDFGFPPRLVDLIMWGVKCPKLSILWNGSKLPSFAPQRGLRQGDPLSPYLFVLCMERLAIQIQKLVTQGTWKPVRITKDGVGISHLFFADDVLLFCQASKEQLQLVNNTLKEFCEASGMKVNLDKSRMLFSKAVDHQRQINLSHIAGISRASDLGKYLGIPLLKGRVTKAHFAFLIGKMSSRLTSWKNNLLNRAGRVCLAKSVLTSIPVHAMQSLWLPDSVCDHLDKLVRKCVWGRGDNARSWNLVSWTELTKPKGRGGLGIRGARANNEALLGKLVHSMLNERDKLWVQCLSTKYLHSGSILVEPQRLGTSYVWRGILKARDAVAQGFGVKLGAGTSSLWYSNWLGTGTLASRLPFVHITDTPLTVADVWREGQWNLDVLYTMIPDAIKEEIHGIPIPTTRTGDEKILWREAPDGRYTTSSAYNWLIDDDSHDSRFWKILWRAHAPERVRFFLWLAGKEALPTNSKRFRCHLAPSATCMRCGASTEDVEHVLRRCPGAAWVWSRFTGTITGVPAAMHFRGWLFAHLQVNQNALFCAIVWNLWKWRNSFVFDQAPWTHGEVLQRIQRDVQEFHRWGKTTTRTSASASAVLGSDCVLLHTDGSWRGDIDNMGGGGVLRDRHGRWLSGFSMALGTGNAFQAELAALHRGLVHTWELGHRTIICHVDCLVLQQVILNNSDVQDHWHGQEISMVRALLARDWDVTLSYVPRDRNVVADALAKLAVQEGWDWKVWSLPPTSVVPLLCHDIVS
ncbi:uncharacterized protein LOC130713326 [Lotus japonicus]|uniref:uncharacterized protein LOC130713326 n=1 Tax=Lotus japonicus TaxID=34305 RepID=UPI002589BB52|nr:uncharacterized protein LOC130713326 [Lotus japonicus]